MPQKTEIGSATIHVGRHMIKDNFFLHLNSKLCMLGLQKQKCYRRSEAPHMYWSQV
jgi:hypothetical protein